MITGLVEEVGTVRHVERRAGYRRITIDAQLVLGDLELGASVNVNGACQTVIAISDGGFAVETLAASLEKTTLGSLARGATVNLERAVTPSTRLGGHLVQGHVDGIGRITEVRRYGENVFVEVLLPHHLERYCISEGSIAVDGVSLTIAELRGARITANIIPTTWRDTALSRHRTGELVNIEVDVMARYAERLLAAHHGGST